MGTRTVNRAAVVAVFALVAIAAAGCVTPPEPVRFRFTAPASAAVAETVTVTALDACPSAPEGHTVLLFVKVAARDGSWEVTSFDDMPADGMWSAALTLARNPAEPTSTDPAPGPAEVTAMCFGLRSSVEAPIELARYEPRPLTVTAP